jgi:hypothetical protein
MPSHEIERCACPESVPPALQQSPACADRRSVRTQRGRGAGQALHLRHARAGERGEDAQAFGSISATMPSKIAVRGSGRPGSLKNATVALRSFDCTAAVNMYGSAA